MELRVVDRIDDITHVELEGRLDVPGTHAVEVDFHTETSERGRPALVDISGVEFVASLGVGMLFSCAKALDRQGHVMVLVNPQPEVEETLVKVGMRRVIPIVRSVEEALERIGT